MTRGNEAKSMAVTTTLNRAVYRLRNERVGNIVATTDRLTLRKLERSDASFIAELTNQPSFLRFIGDRGVRGLSDGRDYIENGPLESYRQYGFGPYLIERRPAAAVGICGLYQRDFLSIPDLGFALIERCVRRGYASEAARRVVRLAGEDFGLCKLAAIVHPDNDRSIGLLARLGFAYERAFVVPDEEHESCLFNLDLTVYP